MDILQGIWSSQLENMSVKVSTAFFPKGRKMASLFILPPLRFDWDIKSGISALPFKLDSNGLKVGSISIAADMKANTINTTLHLSKVDLIMILNIWPQ